ncbi:uncharacterized protein BX664DRAFT_318869 [Halteromyces radiatus]|uniref:uncharacterized protein n=1 Tax=Halteromyces radiatus TaxID=101107 RepID=UPI00221F07E9|nr:uncharacterized protein BX664DRAFT_318869 [Halteromyces radiatus]KAI8098501.1 hypothetical protein BX664DRAFT_318869 [Halteromyces radiatus]
MVKSTAAIVALVAMSAHNVMGQAIPSGIPTDPAVYSSILSQAEASLSALATNPSFSSLLANPTLSSILNQASSAGNAATGTGGASAAPTSGTKSGASTLKPIGAAALAISAAVAVGML